MITALALDPGRTTGFATATITEEFGKIQYWQKVVNHSDLYRYLDNTGFDHIICETFKFRQGKTGVDLYPCELIGVVHLWQQHNDWVHLWMQEPWVQGGKKVYFSDARLKDMKLYVKGVEHGRSAVKHLLYWTQFGAGSQYMQDQPLALI